MLTTCIVQRIEIQNQRTVMFEQTALGYPNISILPFIFSVPIWHA
jgi:hypothetical protein